MNMLSRVCLLSLVLLSGCGGTDPDKASRLVDLTISAGLLTPTFSSMVGGYSATVGEDVESITVTATAADSDTLVWINGQEAEERQTSRIVSLALGKNTITIKTFYIDYSTVYESGEKTYVVVVTRQEGSWSVGGSVSGLAGVLGLQNNGSDELVLTDDGPFAFAVPLPNADSYDVIVTAQPVGQTCSVTNAQGAISGAAVSDIAVECINTP